MDHLLVSGYTASLPFKSTLSVQRDPPPERDRVPHGNLLLTQLAALRASAEALAKRRKGEGLDAETGMAMVIEVQPSGAIDYGTIEWKREGIEVLSVVSSPTADTVTVHVPDGQFSAFEKRIHEYLTKDIKSKNPMKPDKPAHAALVNAISSFRRAAFEALWTEDVVPVPEPQKEQMFQIWLRVGSKGAEAAAKRFSAAAERFQLSILPGYLHFQGRMVVAVKATRAKLEAALEVLDQIAEIRGVPETAKFFLVDLKPYEQGEWVKDLVDRSVFGAPNQTPYLTLLDTGVNNGHPLLAPLVENSDLHSVSNAWGANDHDGHGTGMAGLTLHGELVGPLSSNDPNVIPHRLESVKILAPNGETPAALHGWVTMRAVGLVEKPHPKRQRAFAMMTTTLGASKGEPTDWSATIDMLAFGVPPDEATAKNQDGLKPRLFVLAAGNVAVNKWSGYPSENDLSPCENPAQAWNALAVGACTHLTTVDKAKWPTQLPLASAGNLAPSSRTSLLWKRTWPFKPDVVAEGGNGCIDAGKNVLVGPESVRLLTTSHDPVTSLLAESGDTSAAAAEIARLCTHLQTRYPSYWPETVRALVVQGAQLTPEMTALVPLAPVKKEKEELLRRFGYGKADLERSMESLLRRPTMVLQETIIPYVKSGSSINLGSLNLHELPWPSAVLIANPDALVEMKITLSYFIEPNPSRRGWQSKFRYQSHGLRFATKASSESEEEFRQRINKLDRDKYLEDHPDQDAEWSDADAQNWVLGSQLRSRGSLHSDTWRGTAAQLAQKSHIAVFPVGGWWKDWRDAEKHSIPIRYAMTVSLDVVDPIDIDLYTPIAAQIGIAIPIVN